MECSEFSHDWRNEGMIYINCVHLISDNCEFGESVMGGNGCMGCNRQVAPICVASTVVGRTVEDCQEIELCV